MQGSGEWRQEKEGGAVGDVCGSVLNALSALHSLEMTVLHADLPNSTTLLMTRLEDTWQALEDVEAAAPALADTHIPLQVLQCVDEGRNPEECTRSRLLACLEQNAAARGKVEAFTLLRSIFLKELHGTFPEEVQAYKQLRLSALRGQQQQQQRQQEQKQGLQQERKEQEQGQGQGHTEEEEEGQQQKLQEHGQHKEEEDMQNGDTQIHGQQQKQESLQQEQEQSEHPHLPLESPREEDRRRAEEQLAGKQESKEQAGNGPSLSSGVKRTGSPPDPLRTATGNGSPDANCGEGEVLAQCSAQGARQLSVLGNGAPAEGTRGPQGSAADPVALEPSLRSADVDAVAAKTKAIAAELFGEEDDEDAEGTEVKGGEDEVDREMEEEEGEAAAGRKRKHEPDVGEGQDAGSTGKRGKQGGPDSTDVE